MLCGGLLLVLRGIGLPYRQLAIDGEGFQYDAESLAVIMAEGYADLCPVILPTFRAFSHAIDVMRGFFVAVGCGCHNHVSFLCLDCVESCDYRCPDVLVKAGAKGGVARGGLPHVLTLETPPASAITQQNRAVMVSCHHLIQVKTKNTSS